jgi:hypothetical protein
MNWINWIEFALCTKSLRDKLWRRFFAASSNNSEDNS